ncbi:hypothetical protein JTE90_011711 [Oedothorax gibbosus]|uniref:Pre-rRNA-processing protein TSR2 homolog n=1 Tax=Oedothorax gibbosus TaxID=931172 RepID=A0AAV6UT16_9ARAC|nr:hypothetical protein JTE90_011711 [Oedothorax gibbosus]
MDPESTFLTYVRHTLKKWSGFQEAINDGMGGPYSKEKESWIGTEVEKYFKQYSNVKPEEIEDYLGTMIENEFDTYFEDGSLEEVSKNFCTAYPLSLADPNHTIFREMHQKSNSVSTPRANGAAVLRTVSTPLQPEEIACEGIEKLSVNENFEEADGWTFVTKKNKKAS